MIKLYFTKIVNAKAHSEGFARNILGKHLKVDSDSLVMCKNEFGKPYLKDYPNTHYNISHTKGAIVCAISDEPVGIDIEGVKKFNKRIAERFFTKSEQDYIFSKKENRDERFAEIWTMKEAYVKWTGNGMVIPFESFDVIDGIIPSLKVLKMKDYVISVCTPKSIDVSTKHLLEKELD